jgi:dipeptidyl-peptidase-3
VRIDWRVIVLGTAFTAACGTGSGGIGAVGCSIGSDGAKAPAAAATTAAATRKYLLETVDDAAVIQLYADGFDALPLKDKTLIWHLYQAALAGRDIFLDQKHRNALEMRALIEAIVAHPQGVDAGTLAQVQRYAKLFWINNGPYNNLTAQKFLLQSTPDAFAAAVKTAVKNGATVTPPGGESLDAMLTRLNPMFFDAAVDPIVTAKTPPPGKDILTASANNLYAGVTLADLKGSRRSTGSTPAGEAEREARRRGLPRRRALFEGDQRDRHAPRGRDPVRQRADGQRARALAQFYRTGEKADREKYDIAWVNDKASPVDTINGFIEVYLDARGVKGGWEGLVFYVNQEKTARIKKFADNAQWFEDHMPYDAKFRKPMVTGIVANAIDVVVETGDSGPVTPIGINLPNDQAIRERYGSKSVTLSNVRERATPARRTRCATSSRGRPRNPSAPTRTARSRASCSPTCTR